MDLLLQFINVQFIVRYGFHHFVSVFFKTLSLTFTVSSYLIVRLVNFISKIKMLFVTLNLCCHLEDNGHS